MAGRVRIVEVCCRQARRMFAPRRARTVAVLLSLQTLMLVLFPLFARPAAADAVKGAVTAVVENGFARLVFSLGNDVESQVRVGNNVVVITFDRQVDLNVERLRDGTGDYIGAARKTPTARSSASRSRVT